MQREEELTLHARNVEEGRMATLRPWVSSAALVVLLLVFCSTTHWGRTYPEFAENAWKAWQVSRVTSMERRREALYGDTYDLLRSLCDATPPDAVILLPPTAFIIEKHDGQIPLLGSPSSVYGVIYPRVPVHHGSASPRKTDLTHLLIWEHWGLEYLTPSPDPGAENRVQLVPILKGDGLQW